MPLEQPTTAPQSAATPEGIAAFRRWKQQWKSASKSPLRRLSSARLNEYRDAFRTFDKDASGAINTRELKALMASVDQICSDEEIEQMIASVDLDGSGEMEFSEFLLLMSQRSVLDPDDENDEVELTVQNISRRFKRSVRDDSDDGSMWSRAIKQDTRELPMRRALTSIRRGSKLKSFLAFIIFYFSCAPLPLSRCCELKHL